MEFIKLSGNPGEIGHQHGTQLKSKITKTWEFYSQVLFGNQLDIIEEYGYKYLNAIRAFSENYAIEIEAIAKSSGRLPWQIAALNARTEIFQVIMEKLGVGECTSLYFPGSRLLGQNWDWMEQLEPLFVLMQIEREDGLRILQMTEPGIIGKIGLNSKGIGVCLNITSGSSSPIAVPVHVMLRYVLDSSDVKEVARQFQGMQRGAYSNILMADDKGCFVNMEFSGTVIEEVDFESGIPLHTNHYLSSIRESRDNKKDILYKNSLARFTRAQQLLENCKGDEGLGVFKSILLDAEDKNEPICAEYTSKMGFPIGTVCSIIMDLTNRTMHITAGNPKKNEYTRYNFT